LIVAGGWDGHQPKQCGALMAEVLRKEGFEVEVSETMDVYLDEAKMKALSLIVPIWTMGNITGEQSKGLLSAIKAGVGCAGFHGGMGDAFRSNCEYQFMVGGQFVGHPDGIIEYQVDIVNKHDPITKGLNAFKIKSEQYYMHVDPANDVLCTTTPQNIKSAPWINGVNMPVVWKKMYGEGKVFFNSLGHVATDFDVPEALEIQRRGYLWAAR
jgi:uncharacterized protein